jgi:hypothetical protein
MNRIALAPVALLALASLTGCDEVVCTEIAVSSVEVVLTGPDGEAIYGADLTYSVDGGAPQDCIEMDWYGDEAADALVAGNVYICGWEEAGDIEVFASAEGYADGQATVFVDADECHVQTQSLLMQLESDIACTEQVRYGVEVLVTDDSGPAEGAYVTWSLANADMMPIECQDAGQGWYVCAEEADGLIEIWAENDAMEFASAMVEVESDVCGPITELVELHLGECG